MAITYTWNFGPLDCEPSANGLTNVVKTVHWRYVGTDGTNTSDVYGSVSLGSPDPNTYIQYSNLTINTVIGWVTSSIGNTQIESYQNVISTAIANKVNPPIVSNNPPWVK